MDARERIAQFLTAKGQSWDGAGFGGGVRELTPEVLAGALGYCSRDDAASSDVVASPWDRLAGRLILYLYAGQEDALGGLVRDAGAFLPPLPPRSTPERLSGALRGSLSEFSSVDLCRVCAGKGEVWVCAGRVYAKQSLRQAKWLATHRGSVASELCTACAGTGGRRDGWPAAVRARQCGIPLSTFRRVYASWYEEVLALWGQLEQAGIARVAKNLRRDAGT